MKKVKKWSFAVGILLIGMIVLSLAGFFPRTIEANAETNYFSAEQYTESDKLLQADGTLSPDRTIQNFAEDVRAANYNYSFPELSQVVPLKYLECTEHDEHYHFGQEYGFYLTREGDYIDLILIDFTYEFDDFDHTKSEYLIRIEPILTQRFRMSGDSPDQYKWQKTVNVHSYYVLNPRFMTILRNENDLNYGDDGYSKLTDDGAIILQSRLNYSAISSKTAEEIGEACEKFAIDTIVSTVTDLAVKAIDKATGGVAGFIRKIFNDISKFTKTLYDARQKFYVNVGNTETIFSENSKEEQKVGSQDGYSRVASFIPSDDIILGLLENKPEEESKSYAEYINLLDNTEKRSRLNQYCEFDIVKVNGTDDSLEILNDNGNGFLCSKERILFSEGSEKTLAFDTAQTTYNLSHGTDMFIFSPSVSGTYTFTADEPSANLSLYTAADTDHAIFSGSNSDSAYLQGGTDYLLYAGMNNDENGRYTIQATVSTWESGTTKTNQPIPAGGQLYKVSVSERGGYQISSSNENTRFRLYDDDMQYLYESDPNHFTYYLASGEQYYVRVYSTTSSAQTATLTFSTVDSMAQGTKYTISENYPVMYRFTAPSTLTEATYYTIVFKDFGNDFDVKVFGNSSPISYASATSFYSMNFTMEPGEEVYIQMESSTPFTVTINQSENLFTWTVDGEEQENSTILLKRGEKYQIGLKIDGVQVDNVIYSDKGLLEGTTLDLTSYQYITDPAKDETYLTFFAIKDNSPLWLKICVTHNFNFQFDTYTDNLGYGFTWKNLSSDSSESFDINYIVKAGNKISETQELEIVRDASSQTVMDIVQNSLMYSGYEDITIEIVSVDFRINDSYGEPQERTTIYNTESDQFDQVHDIREQYQNFTCADLKVNPLFDGGSGTVDDPFQIKYFRHFDNIRKVTRYDDDFKENGVCGYYILTGNITLPSSFMPLDNGYAYFSGGIDGNGYSISNYVISGSNMSLGLIRNNYAHILDLSLKNFYIDVSGDQHSGGYAGALCAVNHAVIENVDLQSSTIMGTGYSTVGGIVGFNENGSVEDCSASTNVTITGTYVVGGIAGSSGGDIEDSTFSGRIRYTSRYSYTDSNGAQVNLEAMIGGIAGCLDENGAIEYCKFKGNIIVNIKFWDDRTLQPRIGGIVGTIYSGKQTNNTSTGTIDVSNLNPDVSWWSWFVTYHHNQRAYCGKIVGSPVVSPLS